MALTPADPLVKNADTRLITKAKAEDQRHRLHAEACTDMASASPYFAKWVKEYLEFTIPSKSKRDQVLRQIVWPLVSVELVDDIMDSAAAVHYAQDRFISVELTDDTLQADAEQYLERIDLAGFVARSCHNALFSAPNSLIVVDVPQEQAGDFPEPYCYLLPSAKLHRALPLTGPSDSGLMQFVYFDTDNTNRRGLFDTEDFAVYERASGIGEWTEVFRAPHNLPFCPAFKLWADVDESNPLCSSTMIRAVLGLLDRYVFLDASKQAGDLAAAHPMFWHLQTEACNYQTRDGYTCQKGIIERPVLNAFGGELANMEPIQSACPIRDRCPNHAIHGPGTRIPIPAQKDASDADYRVPAGWISADVPNLKYIEEQLEKLRAKILSTATGSEAGPQNQQALNESQIMSLLESARQVGQYLAQHFETLHRRLIDALLTLRYGPSYVGCTVNYGRRFAMLSGDQLHLLYEGAQKLGAVWLIEEIDGMLQDYYARADASRKLRYRLLTDLNPYPFAAPADLLAAGQHVANPQGFALATGLMGFIKRFEREQNVPLERFGILKDYSFRVTEILKSLTSYVAEQKPVEQPAGVGVDDESGKSGKPGDEPNG